MAVMVILGVLLLVAALAWGARGSWRQFRADEPEIYGDRNVEDRNVDGESDQDRQAG
jgi:hypothetical protein